MPAPVVATTPATTTTTPTTATTPATTTPTTATTAPATGTIEEARNLLVSLSELPGSSVEKAQAVLQKHGAKLGAIPADKLGALIADLKAAIASHGATPAPAGVGSLF